MTCLLSELLLFCLFCRCFSTQHKPSKQIRDNLGRDLKIFQFLIWIAESVGNGQLNDVDKRVTSIRN